jgi:hypothetical protein
VVVFDEFEVVDMLEAVDYFAVGNLNVVDNSQADFSMGYAFEELMFYVAEGPLILISVEVVLQMKRLACFGYGAILRNLIVNCDCDDFIFLLSILVVVVAAYFSYHFEIKVAYSRFFQHQSFYLSLSLADGEVTLSVHRGCF